MNKINILDWHQFVIKQHNGKDKFDGLKFEALVRDLLKDNFSGNWTATSQSWDGGKDFVDRSIQDGEHWVECKMHRKSLSIATVSNTLVMAVLNTNVKKILIFSHSQLNKQTKRHLANFSSVSAINIQSFYGEILEKLIIQTQSVLKKYFVDSCDLTDDNLPIADPLLIAPYFSTNPSITHSQTRQGNQYKADNHVLALGEISMYQILFQSNEPILNQKVHVDLSEYLKDDFTFMLMNKHKLECRNDQLTIELLGGELKDTRLYLAPKVPGKSTLPEISVKVDGQLPIKMPAIHVKVQRLHHPGIIGSYYLDALAQFEGRVSANYANYCVVIAGKSGVGKSRYLNECNKILLTQNYHVCEFDIFSGNIARFGNFIRYLLARVWRLPDPIGPDLEGIDDYHSSKGDTLFEEIVSIIYSSPLTDEFDEQQFEHLIDCVIYGIAGQNTAIIIDNVQALDDRSIDFVQKLENRICSKNSGSVLLMAFNEQELIYSHAATTYLTNLKSQCATNNTYLQGVFLREFSRDEVEMFLDNIISVVSSNSIDRFSSIFPRLVNNIIEHVLPRPLDLFQLVKLGEDSKCITYQNNTLFIDKPEHFNELISSLALKTSTIMEKRWRYLSAKDDVVKILILTTLLGEVNHGVIEAFNIDLSKLNELQISGFLKSSLNVDIKFYHPSIEKHFSPKLILDRLNVSDHLAVELFNTANDLKWFESQPIVFTQLAHLSNNMRVDYIRPALKAFMVYNDVPTSSRRAIAAQVVEQHLHIMTLPEYLYAAQTLSKIRAHGKTDLWCQRLRHYSQEFWSYKPSNAHELRELFRLFRQAASFSSSIEQSNEGINILRHALNYIEDFNDQSEADVARIKADLLNRYCVILKFLGKSEKAHCAGLKAITIAQEFGFYDIQCLTNIDLGYIYYGLNKEKDKVLDYWNEAISLVSLYENEIRDDNPDIIYVCKLIRGMVDIVENNEREAILHLEDMINIAKQKGDVYYHAQGSLIKIIALFRLEIKTKKQIEPNRGENLIEIVRDILDFCISTNQEKYLAACYTLIGHIFHALGKHNDANSYYQQSISKQISVRKNNQNQELKDIEKVIINSLVSVNKPLEIAVNYRAQLTLFNNPEDNSQEPKSIFGIDEYELPCP